MTIENKLAHIRIYLKKLKFANENCDGMGWDKLSKYMTCWVTLGKWKLNYTWNLNDIFWRLSFSSYCQGQGLEQGQEQGQGQGQGQDQG